MSMETNETPALEPPSDSSGEPSNFILGEIQVILSEKRTALSSMRTGIAIFALPLSVLSVLIATSRYYNVGHVLPLLLPLLLLNVGLVVLGSWLIWHSIRRLHHYDRRIRELTQKYRSIAEFIE
jgi:Kef-type K+ transport system membrane component KefB